jgi:predicted DNA binding protein
MSIIVEFSLASPRLNLHEATTSVPDARVTVESVDGVPPEDVHTVLWASDGDLDAFDDALRADPTVTDVELLDSLAARNLYRYRVSGESEVNMYREWVELGAAQLYIECQNGEWFQRVRFPDREALAEFKETAIEEGLEFTLHRIYSQPGEGDEARLTPAQQSAVETALDAGYLEVPKEAALADVATELGVSEQSASERLRRAMRNLARDAVDGEN